MTREIDLFNQKLVMKIDFSASEPMPHVIENLRIIGFRMCKERGEVIACFFHNVDFPAIEVGKWQMFKMCFSFQLWNLVVQQDSGTALLLKSGMLREDPHALIPLSLCWLSRGLVGGCRRWLALRWKLACADVVASAGFRERDFVTRFAAESAAAAAPVAVFCGFRN